MKLLGYGFLFALFLLQKGFSATPLDFSEYRFGQNNRRFFETIIKDLMIEYGQPVTTSYGKDFQAKIDRIVVDEDKMEKYLKETQNPKEQEAIARFILAHEYFHVALKHVQTSDRVRSVDGVEILGTFSEARKQMEQQVDHLAAKYLHQLGLPTEPVQRLFLSHPEFHGGDSYPSAQERVDSVLRGARPGIEESYFDNQFIKCTFAFRALVR
ncbi:MAG: hypothetical protein EBQ92_10195 [Proteobacteria bacterium]|nr:hypothetical protein [Pseudomonadota bacterium]